MAISSQHDLAFWAVTIVAVFKIASLVVGLGFGYMGYRLKAYPFVSGWINIL
jgi:hypothetical protein